MEERPEFDFVHLPADVEPISMWQSLHDATIVTLTSDLVTRRLVMSLEITHLAKHAGMPEDTRFRLSFENTASARCASWFKHRLDSLSWSEAERLINEATADVMQADLALKDDAVALRLWVNTPDDDLQGWIFIRAERFQVEAVPGGLMELDEFRALGDRYWEDFARRKPK